MTHATTRQPLPAALVPHMSNGYRWANGRWESKAFELITGAWPAGSMSVSAHDMGIWMITHLNKESALGNFEERLDPLDEKQVVAEAKRCMSCGLCFECDNCVVYCPQTAVYRVKKTEATTGRYVATDYDKCIGCHICHDVCPTGYIQMGLGE